MSGVMHDHVHLQSLQGYPEKMDYLRYYYEISEELLGTTWDPHGTHTGTTWDPYGNPRGTHTGTTWEPEGYFA